MYIFSQILGWVGMFLVVSAYFLESTKRISGTSKHFQMMNLFGAIGIGISVFYSHAWSAFVLQIVWAMIATYELIKISNVKRKK